jgi:hypothetical protein
VKSLGRKTLRQKVEIETEKYMKDNYEELAYHAICGQAPIIMQQTEAAVLYALSLHGYGAKRLKEFHEWYCQIMNFPEIMGKTPKSLDVMQVMRERYGIDFGKVCPKFPTYEQYKND